MQFLWHQEVSEIKYLLFSGYPQAEIAERYKIAQPTISRILNGRQWSEVPWPDGSVGGATSVLLKQILYKQRRTEHPLTERVQFTDSPLTREGITEDDIERVLAAQAAKDEEELRSIVGAGSLENNSPGSNKKRKVKAVSLDLLDWDYIILHGSSNPAVVAVMAGDDIPKMKEAIQAVFKQISEEDWNTKGTMRLIEQTRKELCK